MNETEGCDPGVIPKDPLDFEKGKRKLDEELWIAVTHRVSRLE
jgi:hypothetical protein